MVGLTNTWISDTEQRYCAKIHRPKEADNKEGWEMEDKNLTVKEKQNGHHRWTGLRIGGIGSGEDGGRENWERQLESGACLG